MVEIKNIETLLKNKYKFIVKMKTLEILVKSNIFKTYTAKIRALKFPGNILKFTVKK